MHDLQKFVNGRIKYIILPSHDCVSCIFANSGGRADRHGEVLGEIVG